MSHVAIVKVKIRNLSALATAAKRLRLELIKDKTTFKWFGRWVNDYHAGDAAYLHGIKPEDYGKCSHAICVPGRPDAYEIGVVRDPLDLSGEGYVLVYDFWSSQGREIYDRCGGQGCEELIREYRSVIAEQSVSVQNLLLQGFEIQQQENEDNSVTLTVTDEIY